MKTKRYKISFTLDVDLEGLTPTQVKRIPQCIKQEVVDQFNDYGAIYNCRYGIDQDTEVIKSSIAIEALGRTK